MPDEDEALSDLIPRAVTSRLLEALSESRAVAILGPRQVGKTTLARDLIRDAYPATYLTLDNAATRNAALADPVGFVQALEGPTIIDEIQRVPDLMLSIKAPGPDSRSWAVPHDWERECAYAAKHP